MRFEVVRFLASFFAISFRIFSPPCFSANVIIMNGWAFPSPLLSSGFSDECLVAFLSYYLGSIWWYEGYPLIVWNVLVMKANASLRRAPTFRLPTFRHLTFRTKRRLATRYFPTRLFVLTTFRSNDFSSQRLFVTTTTFGHHDFSSPRLFVTRLFVATTFRHPTFFFVYVCV